jgi:aryl-alcohol dehydrogenase-like predicted oxidoreductase
MQEFQASGGRTDAIVKAVLAVAKEVGRSPAQVALAWLRLRPWPVIPIIGARKLSQLEDNLACLDLKLDDEQLKRLESASTFEKGFPHHFYDKEMVRGLVYGGMGDKTDAERQ